MLAPESAAAAAAGGLVMQTDSAERLFKVYKGDLIDKPQFYQQQM